MVWKAKTHSGAKKRFSYTGSGKIKYQKNGRRHLLSTKTPRDTAACVRRGFLPTGRKRCCV